MPVKSIRRPQPNDETKEKRIKFQKKSLICSQSAYTRRDNLLTETKLRERKKKSTAVPIQLKQNKQDFIRTGFEVFLHNITAKTSYPFLNKGGKNKLETDSVPMMEYFVRSCAITR